MRVLTDEAQADRDDFDINYGGYSSHGGCSCFISPPCGFCTHPGNPLNQEEFDDCWIEIPEATKKNQDALQTSSAPNAGNYILWWDVIWQRWAGRAGKVPGK